MKRTHLLSVLMPRDAEESTEQGREWLQRHSTELTSPVLCQPLQTSGSYLWNKDISDFPWYAGHSQELSDLLRSGQRPWHPLSTSEPPKLLDRWVALLKSRKARGSGLFSGLPCSVRVLSTVLGLLQETSSKLLPVLGPVSFWVTDV